MQTFTFNSSDDKIDFDRKAADMHALDARHDLTVSDGGNRKLKPLKFYHWYKMNTRNIAICGRAKAGKFEN